jgi:putative two-component system response regulator
LATVLTRSGSSHVETSSSAHALEVVLHTIGDFDSYTGGHCERVARYGAEITRSMGLSPTAVERVRRAGFVHDIGKILLPESIITKAGSLSDEERKLVELHAELGAGLLRRYEDMSDLAPIVLHDHERWDGSGYPSGLSGESIPMESRIVRVADAFDAMTSTRAYGLTKSQGEALCEITEGSGRDFDPQVVRALQQVVRNGVPERAEVHPSGLVDSA